MAATSGKRPKTPNCFGCKHFYVTYEQDFPYGCRAMAFKAKELPSLVVYKNSGMFCQSFQKKQVKR